MKEPNKKPFSDYVFDAISILFLIVCLAALCALCIRLWMTVLA